MLQLNLRKLSQVIFYLSPESFQEISQVLEQKQKDLSLPRPQNPTPVENNLNWGGGKAYFTGIFNFQSQCELDFYGCSLH